MPDDTLKPFLITKDDAGQVRLTLRETRRNSQGYPWTVATLVDRTFKSAPAARAYASAEYGAKPGEFASK